MSGSTSGGAGRPSSVGLLDRLKAGRDAVRVVPIDGVLVGFRLLTDEDYQAAGWTALQILKAKGETEVLLASADLMESEKSTALLARALVDPESKAPLFATHEAARAHLTRDWKRSLIAAYLEYELEFSPSARTLDGEAFGRLLDEVKKNASTMDLSALNSETLRKLVLSLASPPAS